MKLRATFPVYRYKVSDFEENLVNFGTSENYGVTRDKNNDLLAITAQSFIKDSKTQSIICEGTIDYNKCTGCLACQIGIAKPSEGVNEEGLPSESIFYSYKELSERLFQGNYTTFPSRSAKINPIIGRFNKYTGSQSEQNFTNPLAACYLWELSGGQAFVSCSPKHELSLKDVLLEAGSREGHLDVTLRSFFGGDNYLFVGEGKKNVACLLSDSSREQQKKYEHHIASIGQKHDYLPLFSFLIGGEEEPMYPSDVEGITMQVNRGKFFYDIERNKKRFISLHALRGLGILFISSGGKVCLEKILFPLFENEEVYGLVLGGAIVYRNKHFALENIENYVTFR